MSDETKKDERPRAVILAEEVSDYFDELGELWDADDPDIGEIDKTRDNIECAASDLSGTVLDWWPSKLEPKLIARLQKIAAHWGHTLDEIIDEALTEFADDREEHLPGGKRYES